MSPRADLPFTRVSIRKYHAGISLFGNPFDRTIIGVVEYSLDDGSGLFLMNVVLNCFIGRNQVGEVGSYKMPSEQCNVTIRELGLTATTPSKGECTIIATAVTA